MKHSRHENYRRGTSLLAQLFKQVLILALTLSVLVALVFVLYVKIGSPLFGGHPIPFALALASFVVMGYLLGFLQAADELIHCAFH